MPTDDEQDLDDEYDGEDDDGDEDDEDDFDDEDDGDSGDDDEEGDEAEENEEEEGDEEDDEEDEEADSAAANAAYFVMRCDGIAPATMVQRVSEWYGGPWMSGQIIRIPVPSPFVFRLVPEYPGEMLPMYDGGILLMRDDLIKALHEAGVDNLQLFPAVIQDEEKQIAHTNYKAVNVIGLIACADMGASTRMDPDDDTDLIDVDFDSLVIDETKTGGALLFRLAESVNAIIVHRTVRERAERVAGMTFAGPGQWSG